MPTVALALSILLAALGTLGRVLPQRLGAGHENGWTGFPSSSLRERFHDDPEPQRFQSGDKSPLKPHGVALLKVVVA